MPRATASHGSAASTERAWRPENFWRPTVWRWIRRATSMSAKSASPIGKRAFRARRCRKRYAAPVACRSWNGCAYSFVIANEREAIQGHTRSLDCFAEPVIGRRFAPTRWLAMTVEDSALSHGAVIPEALTTVVSLSWYAF